MIGQLILLYPFHLSLLLLTVSYFKGKCKLNFGAYKSLSVILFIQSINRVLKEKNSLTCRKGIVVDIRCHSKQGNI